jgi:hypothetical protein
MGKPGEGDGPLPGSGGSGERKEEIRQEEDERRR